MRVHCVLIFPMQSVLTTTAVAATLAGFWMEKMSLNVAVSYNITPCLTRPINAYSYLEHKMIVRATQVGGKYFSIHPNSLGMRSFLAT